MDIQDPPEDYSVEAIEVDLPEPVVITLTDAEMAMIREKGIQRTEGTHERATSGTMDVLNSNPNSDLHELADIDIVGMIGEYAYSKYYSLPEPFLDSSEEEKYDPGYDFEIEIDHSDWFKVDVKTRTYTNADLIKPAERPINADQYVYCEIRNENEVHIVGQVDAEVMEDAPVRNHPFPVPTKVVHQRKFDPIPKQEEVTNGIYPKSGESTMDNE